jgi:hydroxyethylthiazole kinase-like uncharacterized protein yjeF
MNYFSIEDLQQLHTPARESHKGQNGKLLIIGGSHLFHAASAWSLTVAARIVDLVLYSSTDENNEALLSAKKHFWDGIVVPRGKVEEYIAEVDCVLIGPGMPREEGLLAGDDNTGELTNALLVTFSDKKWVIDAGALQEMDPRLLTEKHIITPHTRELERVLGHLGNQELINDLPSLQGSLEDRVAFLKRCSDRLKGVTILHKGLVDVVVKNDAAMIVEGGNEGLTKGGTGDVLAGLTAALYCTNEPLISAASASFIEKKTADELYKTVGAYYNSSDLAERIPGVMKSLL